MARHRSVCPPPEEMHKLGEEMIEWVSDKKNNCLHLSQWWSGHKHFTSKVWECMERAQEFLPYYEEALKIIGIQYLDKNSRIRDGISQRWQRVYFKDLRTQEDQDMDEAAKRASKTEEKYDAAALAAAISFMDMLKEHQKATSSTETKPSEDTNQPDSHNE